MANQRIRAIPPDSLYPLWHIDIYNQWPHSGLRLVPVDLLSGTPLMSFSLRRVIVGLPRCRNIQPMTASNPSGFTLPQPFNESLVKGGNSRAPQWCQNMHPMTAPSSNEFTLRQWFVKGSNSRALVSIYNWWLHPVDLFSSTFLMSHSFRVIIGLLRCIDIQPMTAPSPSGFACRHPSHYRAAKTHSMLYSHTSFSTIISRRLFDLLVAV